MLLSIVIPVFNMEEYLPRCLRSCMAQGPGTQIVVVNDGSTDASLQIAEEMLREWPESSIISQENQGLSAARNAGLEAASGDYVWFVDSDDHIAREAAALIREAAAGMPDVIPVRMRNDGEDRDRNVIPQSAASGRDILLDDKFLSGAPFYVYRRRFLLDEGLRFYPGIYHEDNEFTPRMLYRARSAKVIPQALYFVFRSPGSITRSRRPKKAFDCLEVAESLLDFRNLKVRDAGVRKVFDRRISVLINDALFEITENGKEDQDRFDEILGERRRILAPLKRSSLKYRIEAFLFGLFPGRYCAIYKLLKRAGR